MYDEIHFDYDGYMIVMIDNEEESCIILKDEKYLNSVDSLFTALDVIDELNDKVVKA